MSESLLRVLVVDDEAPARERLKALVADSGIATVAGEAHDGESAVERTRQLQPDVVLLDVRMPRMDGLEAAALIARLTTPPSVVFTTAYEQHALAAFDAEALDYLLKPVRRERLMKALQRVAQLRPAAPTDAGGRSHLGDSQRLVPVSEVRLLRAEHKYVSVYFPDGEIVVEESLGALEAELAEQFIRVHRNALAAVAYISDMRRNSDGQWQLQLLGLPFAVEVSRRQANQVRARLRERRGPHT